MPLTTTNFRFPNQTHFYKGKVRDVYTIHGDILLMVVTDRISAFDVVMPRGIPHKGQVLNQIASQFLDATSDIVPNWKLGTPDPMVTAGMVCEPFRVEMVIRGYLTGHAWRTYKSGQRKLCGIDLPEGMKENQPFEEPIITPTTKAAQGHDQDISRDQILKEGIVSEEDYGLLENYTRKLFARGTQMADEKGLILVDTKYEFGKKEGKIYLIDEIHTPDSSRYFFKDEYSYRFENHLPQKQLSKEFVRTWLMENGFQGRPQDRIPEFTPQFINSVSERYIELYEIITGQPFLKSTTSHITQRIQKNCLDFLQNL